MRVKAIRPFKDGSGKFRVVGEEWVINCENCARELEKAGKVKIISRKKYY